MKVNEIPYVKGDPNTIINRPRIMESDVNEYAEYRYMMMSLPIASNAKTIVETGLSMGDSTRIWLEALSLLGGDRQLFTYELPAEQKNLAYVESKIRNYDFEARWNMCWQDSIKGGFHYIDDKIDILYLDSDHTYEQVYSELRAWSEHMNKNGIILGDDTWIAGKAPDGDIKVHDRIYKRNYGTNPSDVYWAALEWSEKNNWNMINFTYPNGKFILHKHD
jgi:predicted O-methyltransferase YrrM